MSRRYPLRQCWQRTDRLSALPSTEVCGPHEVLPELPPSVQPEKLPVSKLPLVTRFGGAFTVTFTAAEAPLVLPAASVSVAVKLWLPFGQARRRISPGPARVRGRRAKLCCPVEHRHRAVSLSRARQGNVGRRDGVAANHRTGRRNGIDGDAHYRAGGAVHRIFRGKTVASASEHRGRIAPRPAAASCRGAKQRGSIEYLQSIIRSGGSVQDQRAGVGNAISQRAVVGRERGDKWDCRARWRSRRDVVRYGVIVGLVYENLRSRSPPEYVACCFHKWYFR